MKRLIAHVHEEETKHLIRYDHDHIEQEINRHRSRNHKQQPRYFIVEEQVQKTKHSA